MTQEEKRIAIAEHLGWKVFRNEDTLDIAALSALTCYPPGGEFVRDLPDYFADLNAMHEAEKTVIYKDGHDSDLADDYRFNLVLEADAGMRISASASQRAEAFVRTLGLTKEGD